MPPSPFVIQWATRLARRVPAPRRALDVAMGRGRHTATLVAAGFRVFGVDIDLRKLRDARRSHPVAAWCENLERAALPRERFELVVVARYLQRDLFDQLKAALVPGGAILYETFTTEQRAHGTGPTSPEHLLQPGELRAYFAGDPRFDILFDEEVTAPEAVARIAARRLEDGPASCLDVAGAL